MQADVTAFKPISARYVVIAGHMTLWCWQSCQIYPYRLIQKHDGDVTANMAPVKRRSKTCRFVNCKNNSTENPNLKFFHFPLNNVENWRRACQNDSIKNLTKNTLNRFHYVCEKHFEKFDYVNILSPYKNKLKPGAVPGISQHCDGKHRYQVTT